MVTGGLENAVAEAAQIHARAFGMFLRSSRQWACKPLTGKAIEKFKDAMKVLDRRCQYQLKILHVLIMFIYMLIL